jgi:pimeloyl-ACP methyl ester carboxylesterase
MQSLILLHGALGSKAQFKSLEVSLSKHFYVHCINFSGHGGLSFSTSPFGIEIFSHELRDYIVINKLHGANIFGYSMGGYVALKLAQTNPDLINKIYTLGTKFDWNPISARQESEKLKPEIIEEKVPDFAATLKKRHAPNDWKAVVDSTREMILHLGTNPVLSKSEFLEITNDCQITRGALDKMVSQQETDWAADHLHFGISKELPNTAHPIEKVPIDQLSAELIGFFN